MKVCNKDQFLFLHIQKTAGTSFNQLLESRFDSGDICPAVQHADLAQIADYQSRFKLFRGHFSYEQFASIRPKLNVLTMLRDPVERALSTYAHVIRDKNTARRSSHMQIAQAENMSLEEFIFDSRVTTGINNRAVKMIGAGDLQLAKERLSDFEFLGITERFDDSVKLLAETFGWPMHESYEKRRVAVNRPLTENVPPEVIAKIVQLNTDDIELYRHGQRLLEYRLEHA